MAKQTNKSIETLSNISQELIEDCPGLRDRGKCDCTRRLYILGMKVELNCTEYYTLTGTPYADRRAKLLEIRGVDRL